MKSVITKTNALHKARRFSVGKSSLQLYSMCAIPVILVFLFNYLPMFGVVLAFKKFSFVKGILGSDWVGWRNFEFFFKSGDLWRIVRNTIGLNAIFIVSSTFAAIVLAIALYEVKRKIFVKTYQTILITPNFLSWVIAGYMAYAFLNPQYGFINTMLVALGKQPVQWYSEAKYWPAILSLANLWKHVGMDAVIYFAALMGISSEYFDAAAVDGATKLQIIRKIIIPFLMPLVTILTILKIGNIFRADFGLFYQLTRDVGALYSTTDVVDTYVWRALLKINDVSMSAAVSLLQSFVGFLCIVVTNYVVKKIEPDNVLF